MLSHRQLPALLFAVAALLTNPRPVMATEPADDEALTSPHPEAR